MAITCVTLLVVTLDNLVVTTAVPALGQDFDASVQSLEWAVSAYALAFAVLLLAGRTLGDRFGQRRIFLLGLTIFTAASAACALAPNVELFDVARAAQGVGAGMIVPLTLAILGDAFLDERRRLAQGLWWGIGGIAVGLGPVVGGALVSQADWTWIFWLNVPIGLVAIALAFALHENRLPGARVDLWSLLLVAAGLGAVVWGVIRGSDVGWTSKQVLPALGAGVLWLGAFAAWQLASPAPVLPFRVRRPRQFAAVNVVSLVVFFGVFGSTFLLMQFLQLVQGDSALRAGLSTLPALGATIVAAPLSGALSRRLGARRFLVLGLLLQAGGLAWFAYVGDVDVTYLRLLPGFLAFGAGVGLFLAPAAYAVLDSVGADDVAQASCANNAVRIAGGALGVAGLTTILLSSGSYASGQEFTDGLVRALWIAAAVAGGGAVVSLLTPGRRVVREVVATVLDPPPPATLPLLSAAQHDPATEHAHDLEPAPDGAADAYQCPVCLGQGWFAFRPPEDPRSQMCTRCYGHGQVLTGSHVPAHIVRDCPDCEGRGFVGNELSREPALVRRAVPPLPQAGIPLDAADDATERSTGETVERAVPGLDELGHT